MRKVSVFLDDITRRHVGELWFYDIEATSILNPQDEMSVSFCLDEEKAKRVNSHLDNGGSIYIKVNGAV